ncbi:MAG: hypothetical protein PHX15_02250 [Candidatus Nanoarchaeia archaeon]|nr:hypothetical protein [Candidatus Nanoarchaeia archaeon]MDD4563365.1 hypothetical protein [Candidatus Nanoarchaeia archaeon]
MKTKNFILCLLIFSVSLIFILPFNSADLGNNLEMGSNQVIDAFSSILNPFFTILFGGITGFLFEKVIFLFIIGTLVFAILNKIEIFSENKKVLWIITISVALLSTRFLVDSELIFNILLPYTIFGVVMTSFLPFIVYFFFVTKFESSTLRKILWCAFGVVFVFIWYTRYNQIGGLSWMYFITALVSFLFLLFDGTIQRSMIKSQFEKQRQDEKEELRASIMKEREDLIKNKNHYSEKYFDKKLKNLQKTLEKIR